jgi:hypothetical protein
MLDEARNFLARAAASGSAVGGRVGRAASAAAGRVETAWGNVSDEGRARLRAIAWATAGTAIVAPLPIALGFPAAGPLILADLVIVCAAWIGGYSSGVAAAITAVAVTHIAGEQFAPGGAGLLLDAVIGLKALSIALVVGTLRVRIASDSSEIVDRDRRAGWLLDEVKRLKQELAATKEASAVAHAQVSDEAAQARFQLETLQSVTDPGLNTLNGEELVTSILDRLREALGSDGVALCAVDGRTGRIFSAGEGLGPLGVVKRSPAEFRENGSRRTVLVHNDAQRVADISLCGWPSEVTSLIAVPIAPGGRLQLVVEVVNRQGQRATEWELALIQVVAERAAGLLRGDSYLSGVA